MEKFKIYNRRYLGSKYKLLEFIEKIVQEHTKNCKIFLDLFAGTGVVADYFNKKYDVVLNDLLRCNYISYECFFSDLEYSEKKVTDIIEKYNKKNVKKENYYSKNFKNTYLNEKNLKKVGFIRDDIDNLFEKKLINKRERAILITSLVYAVDKIANTVGHYDAYRKNGDLEKELILKLPQIENENNKNNKIFCMDANELVKGFIADIVYIDPPYNSRQYSDAYHFLENIATNNKPEVFGVAKKMDRTHIKSKYCLSNAKETLEKLVENIEAKYILFSYNNRDRYPHELSGGEQQRIGILRAIAAKPQVLLMDEPFSALDPLVRTVLQDQIAMIHQKFGTTIVFVTHDMQEAAKLACRIGVMHNGKLVQIGTPEEIKKQPANDYVQSLFSTADAPDAERIINQFLRLDKQGQEAVRRAVL